MQEPPDYLLRLSLVDFHYTLKYTPKVSCNSPHRETARHVAIYKHWYIDCKECGRRITLEIYTGKTIIGKRRGEKLRCPACLQESTYSGDDFRTELLKPLAL